MVKIIVAALSAAVASAFGTISELPREISSLMDETVDPCTDFYSYSCGTWQNNTLLDDNQIINVQTVLATAADKLVEKLLMPNTLGLAPIEDHLKAIRSAYSTVEAIFRGAAIAKATGMPLFVKLTVSGDNADATRYALYAEHPGLPLQKFFFEEPVLWAAIEKPYREYIATTFTLAGRADAEAAADVVMAFVRASTGVQESKRRLQEGVTSSNNRLSLSAANASYPLGVGLQLQGFGFDFHKECNTNTILLENLYYVDVIEKLLRSLSVDELKTIIEYNVLNFNAPFLSAPFSNAHSEFYGKVLYGHEPLPRATICRSEEVWTADTAKHIESFVQTLEAAFETGLDSAGWLDDTTRANAKTKLSKLNHLFGGPKNPKTYPTLTFDPKAYIANRNKVSADNTAFKLAQIGTAVDRQIWETNVTAQTVNAFNQRETNALTLPAAFLQPPNYDAKADPAENYGTIGATIGHEITHGFDDVGRLLDGDGKVTQWWTAAVTLTKTFDEKSNCFIEQFGSLDVKSEFTDDLIAKLDGELILPEVVADNGGLNIAYRAYRDYVHAVADATKYTKEAGEKIFWIRYGQSWCAKNSDANLLNFLGDEHPPNRHRLVGAVQNLADFANVFNCPVDSPMNLTKKCVLWE
ncbi:hypothetical protein DYB26_007912 [Aphanomyces astaci]|uniref:Peptidase M13 C-terminal domain-containing protein n=1 Tax=Aphanomyces astaci TaxID=112090 RepID=A0A3R6ZAK9_APHAT|nr:hypothetical protein DYB26_007912 [Aphanomyces astaci]